MIIHFLFFFFFSSRRRHTRLTCDWSSDVCSSDLATLALSDLHVGDVVRVEGTLQAAGKVLASEIELLVPAGSAEALLRGVVDTVDAQGGSFTVSGLKVTTNASTKLVNVAAVGDLKVGDRVLVQG